MADQPCKFNFQNEEGAASFHKIANDLGNSSRIGVQVNVTTDSSNVISLMRLAMNYGGHITISPGS